MHKRGFDLSLLDSVIEQLKDGKKLNEKFKEHLLSGEFAEFHECHIKPDWLFIYYVDENELVLVAVDTGSHSDIFG